MLSFDIDLGDVERSAKTQEHGQAKVFTDEELQRLFTEGFQSGRDRTLFAICLFTGCRISEAVQLKSEDVGDELITFRKTSTPNKVTRQVEMSPALRPWLETYKPGTDYYFPGRHGRGHLSRGAADALLGEACDRVGIVGASTHSFRRTCITRLRDKGYSLAQIQNTNAAIPAFSEARRGRIAGR